MKVKILVSIAGADLSFRPGQIVTLDDDLAAKWIKTGICASLPVPQPAVEPENVSNDASVSDPSSKKSTRKK